MSALYAECEEGNSAVGAPLMINLPVTEANKKLYWGFCPSVTMHHNVTNYFVGFLIYILYPTINDIIRTFRVQMLKFYKIKN